MNIAAILKAYHAPNLPGSPWISPSRACQSYFENKISQAIDAPWRQLAWKIAYVISAICLFPFLAIPTLIGINMNLDRLDEGTRLSTFTLTRMYEKIREQLSKKWSVSTEYTMKGGSITLQEHTKNHLLIFQLEPLTPNSPLPREHIENYIRDIEWVLQSLKDNLAWEPSAFSMTIGNCTPTVALPLPDYIQVATIRISPGFLRSPISIFFGQEGNSPLTSLKMENVPPQSERPLMLPSEESSPS